MGPPEKKVVEAILLLADEPVTAQHIGEVLERPRADVEGMLQELADEYSEADRGFVLRQVAGGWRLYTSPDCAPWLERFARRSSHARLTAATLEVLAVIAYRGPISRAQIAEIRGVDSDGVVRTLMGRGLVREAGRDGGPGAPALLSVTPDFLERMGLQGLEHLPPLRTFMPDTEAVEEMESKLSPGA
jgi:segregation and condensation protein B